MMAPMPGRRATAPKSAVISEAELLSLATEAARNAYAPYSHLHVGAAVLTEQGNVFAACNVENASYGLTICAERNAIFAAAAHEGPMMRVATLALATLDQQVGTPCGACRQVLTEFGPKATVLLPDGRRTTVDALLPEAFTLD